MDILGILGLMIAALTLGLGIGYKLNKRPKSDVEQAEDLKAKDKIWKTKMENLKEEKDEKVSNLEESLSNLKAKAYQSAHEETKKDERIRQLNIQLNEEKSIRNDLIHLTKSTSVPQSNPLAQKLYTEIFDIQNLWTVYRNKAFAFNNKEINDMKSEHRIENEESQKFYDDLLTGSVELSDRILRATQTRL